MGLDNCATRTVGVVSSKKVVVVANAVEFADCKAVDMRRRIQPEKYKVIERVVAALSQAQKKALLTSLANSQLNNIPSITSTVNSTQSSIAQRSIASNLRLNA